MREVKEVVKLFTPEEIKEYLAGNLCRCSGYEGQLRAMEAFIEYRKKGERS